MLTQCQKHVASAGQYREIVVREARNVRPRFFQETISSGERRETRACRYKVPSINSRSPLACNGEERRGDFERGREKERVWGTEGAKGKGRERGWRGKVGVPHQADNPREARVAHSR